MQKYAIRTGFRYPPGAVRDANGTNFSMFSIHATRVELQLYEKAESPEPFQIITLDPESNRTFYFWHIFVEGLPSGVHYTWRVDGPDHVSILARSFWTLGQKPSPTDAGTG